MGRRPGSLNRPREELPVAIVEAAASLSLIDQAIARTQDRIWQRSIEKEDRDEEYRLLAKLRELKEAKCRLQQT